jgi:mannose-6-phosphate isomerase-like protein (cupin superfamily)
MVRIIELPNAGGDQRGDSFTLPREALEFVGEVKDFHIATIVPAAVRGDHFHLRRKEVIIVVHKGSWRFCWDEGDGSIRDSRAFSGVGTIAILIEPGHSHAIENTGESSLTFCSLSSEPYDPAESVRRVVSSH